MRGVITIKIAEMAKKRGIKTAYRLQKDLGLPPSQAAKLWRGDAKMIAMKTLNKLCNLLDCEPHEILVFKPDPKD